MKTILSLLLITSSVIAADGPITRIHFGSCIKQDRPAPLFETILRDKPKLFIFLGDNIYGDTSDMKVLQAKYDRLAAIPGFAKLRSSSRVLATWDDHDYGMNDSGANYGKRKESQQLFQKFWEGKADARPGVYRSHTFGAKARRVQVIMLDTRYFRGPLKTGERRTGGPYYPQPDPSVPMLGEAQWTWLEQQFEKPADLRIVASSIQCIPEASGQETWSNLPNERKRFFDLVAKTKANGVIIISGDRHWSEISVLDEDVPYPIYDVTSSSINQLHKRGTPTKNRFRALPTSFHQENFGRLNIDWQRDDPLVTAEIVDLDGKVRIAKKLFLSELQP